MTTTQTRSIRDRLADALESFIVYKFGRLVPHWDWPNLANAFEQKLASLGLKIVEADGG